MQNNLYTAGELAKMAGVSLRTIHFYDIKGLLCPVDYSESGYRLYDQKSFATLQHILMLKYLGFSLQQIANVMENKGDIPEHLSQQRKLLSDKKEHLEKLISTIEVVQNSAGEKQWDALLHLLNLMSENEKVIEQYQSSTNLNKRINIHSYSTSTQNWFDWVYERLQIQSGQKILEIGCGNAILWAHNAYKIPENVEITITDRSEGMLLEAQKKLEPYQSVFDEQNIQINYQIADANKLLLPTKSYDLIIANHMLYHVTNIKSCLETVSKALKANGTFCCSTIGKEHMKELHEIVAAFDADIAIEIPSDHHTTCFRLENGMDYLKEHFSMINQDIQDNDLLVDDVEAIYNYVHSYSGNAPYILEKRADEFREMIKKKLEKEGIIYIHKSAGMFMCKNVEDGYVTP